MNERQKVAREIFEDIEKFNTENDYTFGEHQKIFYIPDKNWRELKKKFGVSE